MSWYAPPKPTYIGPPAHFTLGNNKPITRITIHSTVSPCKRGGARAIARYFKSEEAGGSAHYVIDPYEVIQSAYDDVICWHAPPNDGSLGLEMCDVPVPKSLLRWLDPNHIKMLARTARLTARLCLVYDIPPVFLSPADVRAGKRGITTHHNTSTAFGQSTHWDPGAWPQATFMRLVRREIKRIKEKQA